MHLNSEQATEVGVLYHLGKGLMDYTGRFFSGKILLKTETADFST